MRFFSFFPTLISHDEGTFLVIAREIFRGKIYFADIIDTKPIGIFVLLGLFIKYISSSVLIIRLFTAIVIGCTSYVIYKISYHDRGEEKPAIASGVIFIFLVSVYSYFGVFINPELFYTLLTAIGFYIFIRTEKTWGYLLMGFLLGIGFILKYTVLFDLAAWLMFIFFIALFKREWKNTQKVFINCVVACMGFLIPFAILILYYFQAGHLKEFWFYTFGVTSRIPVERTFIGTIIYIGDFHLRYLPVMFFFYYAWFLAKKNNSRSRIPDGLLITWCIMVLVAVIMPGKPFGHYFIQIMVPVSIGAGRFFRNDVVKPVWMNRIVSHPAGSIIMAVLILTNVFMQKHDYFDKPDMPKQVAAYLKPLLKPEDRIFTGNYEAVLYYLLNRDCPVRYVHRSLMCDPEHRSALQVDLAAEMDSLMQMKVEYIIMNKPYCYEPLNEYIISNYMPIKAFEGNIQIYQRK
jgi:4-amino-4-deoxy-L-arabinose transferase-like glycosyltransferase